MVPGLRNTVYHEAIMNLLEEMKREHLHLSGEEIFLRLKQRFPSLNFSTVYRNLEKMAALGLVNKLKVPGHHTRYDANVNPHPHIRCVVCGKVMDWPGDVKIEIDPRDAEKVGFEYRGVMADIIGVCPTCQGQISSDDHP